MTKLLLIEPDYLLRRQYAEELSRDYEVVAVQGAQQAVHAAEEFLPDVIVLEPQLTGHNGVEFLYELRSYDDMLEVQVIVFTSLPTELLGISDQLQRQLGICCVVQKQNGLKNLQKQIADMLQAA